MWMEIAQEAEQKSLEADCADDGERAHREREWQHIALAELERLKKEQE